MGKPSKAKKAKTAVRRASAQTPHEELFSLGARKIKASKIYELWVDVLGRPIRNLAASPNDYGIPNVIAYAAFLNGTPQFSPYGLNLLQADVVNVGTMGKLGGAIVKNFQKNGWTVTPN